MALTRIATISLPPGARPGFDHADVYRPTGGAHRLYVAHTGADRVDVIDCATNQHVGALPNLPGVAGALVNTEQGLLMTSDRAAAQVSLFQLPTEQLLGRVAVDPRPNGLAYDPTRRQLFAFNLGEPIGEGCTASVIDVDGLTVIATIALPGRPRWAVFDPATDCVYANIQLPAVIVVINAATLSITRTIDVPVAGPHGLEILADRLYCAADGQALVALHRDTGETLGQVALPGVPDVVMLDAVKRRLHVAIGDPGVIAVIDTEPLAVRDIVATERGAHSLGWHAETSALYAFLPNSSAIAVFTDR